MRTCRWCNQPLERAERTDKAPPDSLGWVVQGNRGDDREDFRCPVRDDPRGRWLPHEPISLGP